MSPFLFLFWCKIHSLRYKDSVSQGLLNCLVENPFNGKMLPVILADDVEYPFDCDLGLPSINECDNAIRHEVQIADDVATEELDQLRRKILSKAQSLNIGGYASSSKLKYQLISRQ